MTTTSATSLSLASNLPAPESRSVVKPTSEMHKLPLMKLIAMFRLLAGVPLLLITSFLISISQRRTEFWDVNLLVP